MPPRRKDPKLTFDMVASWCNQNGWSLVKNGKPVGYVYAMKYDNADGETVLSIKQAGSLHSLAKKFLKDLGLEPMAIQTILAGTGSGESE